MRDPFERAVQDGIALLRDLPGGRAEIAAARERFATFRDEHPDVRVELVIDWTSDATSVAYDLLLGDGVHGTLAITQATPSRSPWSVAHAEHWAAQRVLTVNGEPLSVHDALRLWQTRAATSPGMMRELLDEALLARAEGPESIPVRVDDTQRSADALRRRLGLHDRTATLRWFEEHGLTADTFQGLARREAQHEQWLDRTFAADARAHFDQHRAAFGRVTAVTVHATDAVLRGLELEIRATAGRSLLALVAERLATHTHEPIEATLESRFAWQWPLALRDALPAALVGPAEIEGRLGLAQVVARSPAVFDEPARLAARSRLFDRWLEQARRDADIHWHWL